MAITPDTADRRLGEGVVFDLQGREVLLSAVFQPGPVVLIWLRHYRSSYASRFAGDHPSPAEIVATLRHALGKAGWRRTRAANQL